MQAVHTNNRNKQIALLSYIVLCFYYYSRLTRNVLRPLVEIASRYQTISFPLYTNYPYPYKKSSCTTVVCCLYSQLGLYAVKLPTSQLVIL